MFEPDGYQQLKWAASDNYRYYFDFHIQLYPESGCYICRTNMVYGKKDSLGFSKILELNLENVLEKF